MIRILSTAVFLLIANNAFSASPDQLREDFMAKMVTEHGFSREQVKSILWQARTQKSILEAIARPAEKVKPWWEYRDRFVTPARVKGGLQFWADNAETLAKAEAKYGVPAQVIVGILGVETNYGTFPLGHSVLDALHTLGFHYPKRGKFFRAELEQFLLLTREEGMDPTQVKGSYAGAMGKPQFMPSSFRREAIDFDGDGKRDIWDSNVDTIGSVAHYLKTRGKWQAEQPITTRLTQFEPSYGKFLSKSLGLPFKVSELRQAGIRLPDNWDDNAKVSLIELEGESGPEYWARLQNFRAILSYNPRNKYAMAVYQLSEAIRTVREQQAGKATTSTE